MSSKILKEALKQQKEVLEEEAQLEKSSVFSGITVDKLNEEGEEEEDIDEFDGFSETQSQFDGWQVSFQ